MNLDEMNTVDKIDHLKTMIQADSEMWDLLWKEEQAIRRQREKVFERKHENKRKLTELLGLNGIL